MTSDNPNYIVLDRVDDSARNRRESYRMPRPAGAGQATVTIGSDDFECEILDESAGGYQISGTTLPLVAPERLVQLRYGTECHRLRVVWRRKVGDAIRFGLQRDFEQEVARQSNYSLMMGLLVVAVLVVAGGYLFLR